MPPSTRRPTLAAVSSPGDPARATQDDIRALIDILPPGLQAAATRLPHESLIEFVLDLGRLPEARLQDKRGMPIGERPVTMEDLREMLRHVGEFSEDNRAGIARTLHRISCIRNRRGEIIGLTLRVGRAIPGTIDLIRDLIQNGKNVLMLGRPGVGKTTKLREAARILADDFGKRVIVIDTSNEIAGDGDVPHAAIGSARRMQVPRPDRQHAVMIEAVENHMPQVIVIDEIGTEDETAAARTIAERGVQLIGTAHGSTLENLCLNPTLWDLVGGVHQVILSDEEARRRGSAKTISERRAPPTFDCVVEMVDRDELIVHKDTAKAVDQLLEGLDPGGDRRTLSPTGRVLHEQVREPEPERVEVAPQRFVEASGLPKIHPYALSRDLLERVLRDLRIEARVVPHIEDADLVIALKSRAEDPRLLREIGDRGTPVHVVKRNTTAQLRRTLQSAFNVLNGADTEEVQEAVAEVEHAIQRVINEKIAIPLSPRRSSVRRLQHRIAARYHLEAESVGSEPLCHLIVHPSA
jgi:stage III sporulation protein SpoIIIAA